MKIKEIYRLIFKEAIKNRKRLVGQTRQSAKPTLKHLTDMYEALDTANFHHFPIEDNSEAAIDFLMGTNS